MFVLLDNTQKNLGKYNRNVWRILKSGAREGWSWRGGPIVWEMRKCYIHSRRRGISCVQ